jgi:predicted nuclease of predicted toxin-antitoxin system
LSKIWLDAQLPPQLAQWLREQHGLDVEALRDLGLRDADDETIFQAARAQNVVLISKDSDFVDLVQRRGPPPKLIWLTCGNVSNVALRELFSARLEAALAQLKADAIVEMA